MRSPLILAFALTAMACQRMPAVDTAAEEQAIRDASAQFAQEVQARNDSAIAMLHTTDAVILPPGGPRVTGRDGVRKLWADFWSMNPSLTLSPETVTVSRGGDLATEIGAWTLSWPDSAGATMHDGGSYLTVWTNTEGGWKVKQDIWNSSMPASPHAAQ